MRPRRTRRSRSSGARRSSKSGFDLREASGFKAIPRRPTSRPFVRRLDAPGEATPPRSPRPSRRCRPEAGPAAHEPQRERRQDDEDDQAHRLLDAQGDGEASREPRSAGWPRSTSPAPGPVAVARTRYSGAAADSGGREGLLDGLARGRGSGRAAGERRRRAVIVANPRNSGTHRLTGCRFRSSARMGTGIREQLGGRGRPKATPTDSTRAAGSAPT